MNMAHRYRLIGIACLGAALIIAASFTYVRAQESTITYPIAELGGCEDKKECHAYCDDLSHVSECVDFAEAHGLMTADEVREARTFAKIGGEGPRGCRTKEECEDYCEDPARMRECISFAKDAGVMSDEELAEAEKAVTYVEQGGVMPGGCRGRACKTYCEDSAHMEECAEFAIRAGFMSEKEAAIFRKTGGHGPGGCRGQECKRYCEDDANRESCIAFAVEHDLLSEEDKQRMEEGREKAKQALEQAPPEVVACIEQRIGVERVQALRDGSGLIDHKLGEILPACFRELLGDGGKVPFGPNSEARDCMREVFGDDFEEKMRDGELDPGKRDNEIRDCMQKRLGKGFLNDEGAWERQEDEESAPHEDRGRMREELREKYEHEFGGPPGTSPEGERRDEMIMRINGEGFENGTDRGRFDTYRDEFQSRRREMEQQMRSEMEAQMRSGQFDPSRLPADYRPEGAFPPPESFLRPPEMSEAQQTAMPPPEGTRDAYTAPIDTTEVHTEPATETVSPAAGEPVSARANFLANVFSVVEALFTR